jgi:hypothetical protein
LLLLASAASAAAQEAIMTNARKLAQITLLLATICAALGTSACGPLAAGAVGAAIGHEVAERNHDDDDRD